MHAMVGGQECGLIGCFDVGRGVKAITHLQFLDDTILLSLAGWVEVVVLNRTLRCFELSLGLQEHGGEC